MNQDFNILVGKRIRQTREMLSMSREKFSEQSGISNSFLADIELGKKSLSVLTLYKICRAADISPAYIMFGTNTFGDDSVITELLSQLDPKHLDSVIVILREFVNAVNKNQTR